jgi:hypothetical protein
MRLLAREARERLVRWLELARYIDKLKCQLELAR